MVRKLLQNLKDGLFCKKMLLKFFNGIIIFESAIRKYEKSD